MPYCNSATLKDRDRALGEGDVTVDDLVHHLAEHEGHEEVEGAAVPDGALSGYAYDDENNDVDCRGSQRGGE